MGWWIYTFATCTYFLHLCFISWLKLCSIGGILKGKALCFPCFVLISSIFFACGAKKRISPPALPCCSSLPKQKWITEYLTQNCFYLSFSFLVKLHTEFFVLLFGCLWQKRHRIVTLPTVLAVYAWHILTDSDKFGIPALLRMKA